MTGKAKQLLLQYSTAWGILHRNVMRETSTTDEQIHVNDLWEQLIAEIDRLDPCGAVPDPRDVFSHFCEFGKRERVQIVAPGQNGKLHYDKLDPDCPTIVVNKAIELPIKKDVWVVADYKQSTIADWFYYGIEKHIDIACLQAGWIAGGYPDARWTFEAGPLMNESDEWPEPINGYLRYGTTVSGQAIQMAYWMGAKEIILCGVDFSGNLYFDEKSRNVKPQYLLWKVRDPMNKLISWIGDNGVSVTTLSETALNVPATYDKWE